jgi:putative endonuclease
MTADERRRAHQRAEIRGRRAEGLAALWLRLKGYRIVARRFGTPLGEIDIIARRGRLLALIEVKARTRLAEASQAISPRQRRRIARAAEFFLHRYPRYTQLELRFDAVLIAPGRLPRHLKDAWRLGGSS